MGLVDEWPESFSECIYRARGYEKPLCKTVKVKPGLHWGPKIFLSHETSAG